MALFTNKYRVESARYREWDYTNTAAYYVTICTEKMKKYFGKIENDKMVLSKSGKIVEEEWYNTEVIRSYVKLDEFVVMPNHVHGILIIHKDEISENSSCETSHRDVSTVELKQLKSGSLGAIVGQFKSKCTKRIRKEVNDSFEWQDRFYDRIIRDETEMDNTRAYISNNPVYWEKDKFYL